MRLLFTLTICLLLVQLQAQKLNHMLGSVIIQVENKDAIQEIARDYSLKFRSAIAVEKTLSGRLGIFLLGFDHGLIHEREFLEKLRYDRRVLVAQFDHITSNRNTPDDPKFIDQWQWVNTGQTGGLIDADINAELAWDITTGGVTALGDTIVVAIIDDGLTYTHPDLSANNWVNHAEIPGNGIDDDNNGYIDDVHGWNVYSNSPDVFKDGGHGTRVAGMIGAVGDNGIGITGINWNVKLMSIVGGTPESAVIASYSYALEQRVLYHESNGTKGAFVVATNSSWGIDFGQPDESPLWCTFYDLLGEQGILSAAATSNIGYSVDELGDLPTACTSEYLMSVTALNHADERNFSAFGIKHVDFGAPGENIVTTRNADGYGTATGTSFASPVAAGLVALLYSVPIPALGELAHADPAAAAKYVRDIIFYGVRHIPSLETETKFGGAVNIGNSMSLLMTLNGQCPLPFGITSENISESETVIDWVTLGDPDEVNLRYRPLAASNWDTIVNVDNPFTLADLLGCTEYIIEFESICADTSSGFLSPYEFKSGGCCELPASINLFANETSFQAVWSHVFAANFYLVQWRLPGQPEWMEEVTSLDQVTIRNLQPCTFYEFRLQTNCDTSETGFSEILTIRTLNCGNCIDLEYCDASSDDSSEEYIDSVAIGPLVNHSGQNGGYAFFENFNPEYEAGGTYRVELKPGFIVGVSFDEQFRIWLDANQDGLFDEDELILDSVLSRDDTILISEIVIPADAREGSTRMRVSMAFTTPFNFDQEPCGVIEHGEIEDYCVFIKQRNSCHRVDTVLFDGITFTGAFMYWPSAEGAIAYTYRYREAGTTDIIELATLDTTAVLSGLKKCTDYEIQIRTVCMTDTTSYDSIYILETDCDVAVDEVDPLLTQLVVYPNPVTDFVTIRLLSTDSGDHNISIYNLQGQKMFTGKLFVDQNITTELEINNMDKFPPGLFIVVIEKDGKTATTKLMKI